MTAAEPTLARKLGAFDATMIVMGGIIGAGIFVNPSVVARQVHTPALEIAAWAIGGLIALIGNPHRNQVARAGQARERYGIPSVGLDAFGGRARDAAGIQ